MVSKLKQLAGNRYQGPNLPETSIPYFDVSYEDIFPELELQEGSKFNKVTSQLHVLKDLFGFQNFRKLEDINNQSFYTLSSCFPELKPRATYTSISSFVNILGEETAVNYILEEPSRIISDSNANQVSAAQLGALVSPKLPGHADLGFGVRPLRRRQLLHAHGPQSARLA